jgi:hypothetical protein
MSFSEIILEKLGITFKKYNFHIVEQRDDYLKLHSDNLEISFSQNQPENSKTFSLNKSLKKTHSIEIDNETLKSFFNSDLRLSEVAFNLFINNLISFFENEGKSLLMGDLNKINELESFSLERSQIYTHNILKKQILKAADNAWDQRNYKEFISLIGQINNDKLPLSYHLKYKIANK